MSVFGDRMKYLREKKEIKQIDLSRDLHITQTAVSNYEKGIRFPNEGLLIQIADYFNVSVDFLLGRDYFIYGGTKKEHNNIYEDQLQQFTNEFINRRYEACHQILDQLRSKGVTTGDIYTFVIQPTLYVVGSMWESGQITIAEEHFFTESMLQIMQEQSRKTVPIRKREESIVLMSVLSEEHNIGIRMIGHVLREEGYGVHYLGGNLPTEDMILYMKKYDTDLLALSVTMSHHIGIAKDIIGTVRKECPRVKIVVGGQAFKYMDYHLVDGDAYAPSANLIVSVIDGLLGNEGKIC